MRSFITSVTRRARRRELPERSLGRRILAGVAAVASVMLVAGGLVFVGAESAQAHTPGVSATCSALSVDVRSYEGKPGVAQPNSVTVTIDDKLVDSFAFGTEHVAKSYPFSDPSVSHTYRVQVTAWNDTANSYGNGPNNWTHLFTGSSPTCAKPTVTLDATKCSTVGGSTSLSSNYAGLQASRSYTLTLTRGTTLVASRTLTGVTAGPVPWGAQQAGSKYTVTLKDSTAGGVSASVDVTVTGCPKVGGFSVELQQCSAVPAAGALAAGTIVITAEGTDWVSGRSYTVTVTGDQEFTTTINYVDGKNSYPIQIPLKNGGTTNVKVGITDGAVTILAPTDATLLPCPTLPRLSIDQTACTLGATSNDVNVTLAGLTDKRVYLVKVVDGNGTVVGSTTVTASGTTASVPFPGVKPGTYAVTATDASASSATASGSVTVAVCPTKPTIVIDPTQCATPDKDGSAATSASLVVNAGNLASDRSYTVTVTVAGKQVSTDTFTATSATKSYTLEKLPAGAVYEAKIVDDGDASEATATGTGTFAKCPPMPQVGAVAISCSFANGTSTLTAQLGDIAPGNTWTLTLSKVDSTTGALTVIAVHGPSTSQQIGASFTSFPGIVNGTTYQVDLRSSTNAALNDTAIVPIENCGAGTTTTTSSTPPTTVTQLKSLALTGESALGPALGALVLLQLGLALLGVAIIRRRKQVRD